MKKVSFCVVTHNNSDTILGLLKSIYQSKCNDCEFTVFVVDNSSTDNTVQLVKTEYPETNVIKANCNKGFGYAQNLVLNKIDSDFHVIVNPDIFFEKDVVNELIDYLVLHKNVVIVTPRIFSPDGTEQHLAKKDPKFRYLLAGRFEKFFPVLSFLRSEYTMRDIDKTNPFEIEFCTGCFVVIRTEIFKKLNGFDDRFFMYFEDADLSRRARKFGKIIFYPHVCVTHLWERASAKSIKFLSIHIFSMIKYFKKWKRKV